MYLVQVRYYKSGSNACRAAVLTPDGGIIECTNEAAADRVAAEFNEKDKLIKKLTDEVAELVDRIITNL